MDIQQLRRSLKQKWLEYYRENRSWLVRLGIWVTHEGQRRPSSSFILATLSILEPNLHQLLPLIVELSSSPDRIVVALGLNFNPDDELEALAEAQRMLPGSTRSPIPASVTHSPEQVRKQADEACRGIDDRRWRE